MSELKEVTIYADGCCIGNPGPGGYGVILMYKNSEKQLSGGFRLTTSNRMEIMAAIVGLKTLKVPCSVTLYSDSEYLVNAIVEGWVHRWKANNWWRNKKEKAINVDLWDKLLDLCAKHTVKFVWIKSHAGHPYNEKCDALSREAASQQNLAIDEGYEKLKDHGGQKNEVVKKASKIETNRQPICQIQVEFEGGYYTWNGNTWYDKNFLIPSQVLINKLNMLLMAVLEQEDENIHDVDELLERARGARDSLQYERAQKLARCVITIFPDHLGAIAVLCSCLRANGHAQQAIDETDGFDSENYPPLLNSRAAALCDLGRWEEAKKLVSRSRAIGSEEAFSIINRIKGARPDLYYSDDR